MNNLRNLNSTVTNVSNYRQNNIFYAIHKRYFVPKFVSVIKKKGKGIDVSHIPYGIILLKIGNTFYNKVTMEVFDDFENYHINDVFNWVK